MSFNTKIPSSSFVPAGSNIYLAFSTQPAEESVSEAERQLFDKAQALPRDQGLSFISAIKSLAADIKGKVHEMRWRGVSEEQISLKSDALFTLLQDMGEKFIASAKEFHDVTSDAFTVRKNFIERLNQFTVDFRDFVTPPPKKAPSSLHLIRAAGKTQSAATKNIKEGSSQIEDEIHLRFPPRDQLTRCLNEKYAGPTDYLNEKGVIAAAADAFANQEKSASDLERTVSDVLDIKLKGVYPARTALHLTLADALDKCAE